MYLFVSGNRAVSSSWLLQWKALLEQRKGAEKTCYAKKPLKGAEEPLFRAAAIATASKVEAEPSKVPLKRRFLPQTYGVSTLFLAATNEPSAVFAGRKTSRRPEVSSVTLRRQIDPRRRVPHSWLHVRNQHINCVVV